MPGGASVMGLYPWLAPGSGGPVGDAALVGVGLWLGLADVRRFFPLASTPWDEVVMASGGRAVRQPSREWCPGEGQDGWTRGASTDTTGVVKVMGMAGVVFGVGGVEVFHGGTVHGLGGLVLIGLISVENRVPVENLLTQMGEF